MHKDHPPRQVSSRSDEPLKSWFQPIRSLESSSANHFTRLSSQRPIEPYKFHAWKFLDFSRSKIQTQVLVKVDLGTANPPSRKSQVWYTWPSGSPAAKSSIALTQPRLIEDRIPNPRFFERNQLETEVSTYQPIGAIAPINAKPSRPTSLDMLYRSVMSNLTDVKVWQGSSKSWPPQLCRWIPNPRFFERI
jgi:hypothetical protein